MQEIILDIVLCVLSFIGLVASFVFSKKQKSSFANKLPFGALALFLIAVGFTGYKIVRKSYHFAKDVITYKSRSGIEIYVALFGKAENCVSILNKQDQVIPKIDYAIWLYGKTCGAEVNRILLQKKYTFQKVAKVELSYNKVSDEHKNWFNPTLLGDSILVYTYQNDNTPNIQNLYIATDSSAFYCQDIYD